MMLLQIVMVGSFSVACFSYLSAPKQGDGETGEEFFQRVSKTRQSR